MKVNTSLQPCLTFEKKSKVIEIIATYQIITEKSLYIIEDLVKTSNGTHHPLSSTTGKACLGC